MNFENISVIHVYFMQGKQKKKVGRLALKSRKIYFEYDPDFLQTKLELSPFNLPLKAGVQTSDQSVFEGLFGVFNDSLPDGWGRLLIDRKLRELSINPGVLSPLDRLRYVGSKGMGALIYEPEITGVDPKKNLDLDEIADETISLQNSDDDNQFVDDLLAMNGSSAGARPKILVNIDKQDWIIKFRSFIDPKDIGSIEYAYNIMAKNAGLEVPEAKLFPSKKCSGYFAAKRFDRKNGNRLHIHSISGLLNIDHRFPNLDYETILKVTSWLTKDIRESEKQFRAAVFNILSHNRDDHAKNFSFLLNENGIWQVAPAYDLTFSSGPGGEHCSMIMGEGKTLKLTHILKLAEIGGLTKQKALEIIDQVKCSVSRWEFFAKEANVSKSSCSLVKKSLDDLFKNL
jgi:serine/threonine-protein kinase HipA